MGSGGRRIKKQRVADRVVKFRISAVLSADGGLLERLAAAHGSEPAQLGSQRNAGYIPWIHIDDMVGLFSTALKSSQYDGLYNAVAGEPVTMATLIDAMACVLENKPAPETSSYSGVGSPRLNWSRQALNSSSTI